MRVENESDSSWGKSEFENGNESSHMSDAKKYANFSGFRYSPTICWGRVYGEGKTHPGKVYHLVEVYLPLTRTNVEKLKNWKLIMNLQRSFE